MRNVIVVGAGVGGLYAAKRLSELGYHVKIIEARAREELGYPWYDSVGISTFRSVGMKLPEGTTIPKQILNFYAPSGEGKIKQPTRFARGLDVQREKLVRHMIAMCEPHCQFLFKEKVKELIIEDNAVKGVRTEKRTLHSDLVIDASGLFSPCRLSTPDSFYLNDPIGKTDYIVAYREEYSRKDVEGEPEPNVYLYPKNLMLAWCKSEPDTGGLDVFFGNYGDVTDEEKAEGLAFLKERNPHLGDLRSSRRECVSLRYPMGVLSAPGYVLVGGSAFMAIPFNGSGIEMTLGAAKDLVSVIKKLGDAPFTAENLWQYTLLFVKHAGARNAAQYVFRQAVETLPREDLDFLFTSGLFDKGIVAIATLDRKHMRKVDVRSFLSGFRSTMQRKDITKMIRGAFTHAVRGYFLARSVPNKYDPEKVAKWKKDYDAFMRGAFEKVKKIFEAAKK